MKTALTFFSSLFESQGRGFTTTWPRFFDRCKVPMVCTAKEDAPRWSPATFTDNRRSLANVIDLGAVVLDVDNGAAIEAIADCLSDFYACAHSTFSSTAAKPRSRIIVPLDRRVNVAESDRCWRWFASNLERAGIAPDYAARDASRIWSVPAMPSGAAYECRILEGAFASVDDALVAIPAPAPLDDSPVFSRGDDVARRMERARLYLRRCDPAISGAYGHRAMFRAALVACRGFNLSEDDALEVIAEYNERAQPPFSRRELLHKVKSASTRARVAAGWLLRDRRGAA